MRVADNRIATVLGLYRTELAPFYSDAEARAIARAVFHARMGLDAAALELRREQALSESELLRVYDPIKRLAAGEPLQYVLGTVHFHGMELEVAPGVLIPRPETEELVDRIVRSPFRPSRIVDIGTGSGCIALALKRAFPPAQVTGIDVSEEALAIARRNGMRNGLEVEWSRADVLDPAFILPVGTDLVVSNPPYVPRSEENGLADQVRRHEPHLALFVDDADPLLFHRRIAASALAALPTGGQLWCEGHYIHAPAVGTLLEGMGFTTVDVIADLSGHPRFIHAVR
ncbi:MAG: peptide chain release factor N(5)-glutamine methyltransferase [Flavobacteriales bacterium]|jgi:release factor glutamine methyltransferase|nr:peptide chain release factor N(5)-glutamine methyltransferase [Flavobacteriales bacterium]